jgi:LDH2 family malate/lactate/ureidoglycolate dehydrogenase
MTDYMKSSPLAEGFDKILYPGEKEAMTRQERRTRGIEVEDATWKSIRSAIHEYGLEEKLGPLP